MSVNPMSVKWWALIWLVALLVVIVFGPVLADRMRAAGMKKSLERRRDKLPKNSEERGKLDEELAKWQRPVRARVLGVVMGDDERLSTTKSVALLWTLVIAYVILALILVWPSDWGKALQNLNGSYLALLGGPIATVVLSKVIVSTRLRRGTIQKPEGDGIPRLGDLVADDSGNTDLFDLQYILFNVVAVIFVLTGFSKFTSAGFPEVPEVLWLLTAGPAAVFVSNKAFGTNAPAIFSVDPGEVRKGESFTVYGQNFIVGDAAGAAEKVSVQINGARADVVQGSVSGVSVRATVPEHLLPSDSAVVTVVTDAGVHVSRRDLLAVVREPVVNPLAAGTTVARDGSFLLTGAWNPGPHGLTVLINDVAAATANASGNAVTVTVPMATQPGTAQVRVLDAVGRSEPVPLNVSLR
ncbi:IPT/TIG domain-containing protein [Couchioplanes caeruleus]|uniref:IPT/TIG domain-containing protein n=2 Tax=Couchioplanes caeruleus TaxID=56438 RepID=A0A1K0GB78_9ACTN|nr:IPT/TIG domain-containing protein [Couchioplanes caeruleus]OJF14498.1 hypothetical protein BG844_09155 [Couchioplanes caeruleus subsp. caeruleus]ROP21240.1 IPT/TIG domain-containing protein [Couchioplanes caeruleus]